MAETAPPREDNLQDLYLETNKLYVGTVLDIFAGDYKTINLQEKTKFFPRSDEMGFILHNSKINTFEEIGQKVVDLKKNFDNIFYPRHYNHAGVVAWYHGLEIPFPYGLYNYLLKLNQEGVLEGEENRKIADTFFGYVGVNKSPEEIKKILAGLKVGGAGGSYNSYIDGLPPEDSRGFFDTFPTSLLMTTNLNVFDDINEFNIKDTERIIYIFDKQKKLAAVICKLLPDDVCENIGYTGGEQAQHMLTKDNDILFINYEAYYYKASGEEFNYEDYMGPWIWENESNTSTFMNIEHTEPLQHLEKALSSCEVTLTETTGLVKMEPDEQFSQQDKPYSISMVPTSNSNCSNPSSASPADEGYQRRQRRSEAELKQASDMVARGMTFQVASEKYNIPISTIRFYMARKGILQRRKRGRGSSNVDASNSQPDSPSGNNKQEKNN